MAHNVFEVKFSYYNQLVTIYERSNLTRIWINFLIFGQINNFIKPL